ncbi:MAG: ABC transporter substrate-binding protein [Thermomicrobiales bacterium]
MMIDPMPRPGRPADGTCGRYPVADLIQARIDGRISRRDLIRRATRLGIASPVVGVMLHATSDFAFGAPAPRPSRTRRAYQEAETVPADAPTKPTGDAQQGSVIVAGTTAEIETLHPYLTNPLDGGFDVWVGVVDGLLVYDAKQQLQPALAERFEVSRDGLTYTFELRQGVTFHNGDDFTAQAVVDSWQMIVDPEFGAYNKLGWDKIETIEAPDDHTVVMTTKEVYAPFLSYVGTTGICPSRALAEGVDLFRQEFGRRPIGTGPMKVAEWNVPEQVTLERNDDYWGRAPKLDEVVIRVVPDAGAQLAALAAGEMQVVGSTGALSATRVDAALAIEDVAVLEHPSQSWYHLDLKHVDFLRITKVRQALDFATPTQEIIDTLLKGRAVPAVADQMPGTWAHNPNIEPRPHDPERAKELMAEAGLRPGADGVLAGTPPDPRTIDPNALPPATPAATPTAGLIPFEMELWGLAGNAETQQIVEIIAANWNAIGIKTTTKFESPATIWGTQGYQFSDKMTACLYPWVNSNDPDDLFYWHSSQIPTSPTGPGYNLPAFFFPYNFQEEIDKLTEDAVAEVDQEQRKELYWQIQELLHEEVPVIFLYWAKVFPVAATTVGGFWPSAFNNLLWNVQDWYLAEGSGVRGPESGPDATSSPTPNS